MTNTNVRRLIALLIFLVGCSFPKLLTAELVRYELSWSGAKFGNDAVASGQITIDTSELSNPGVTTQSMNTFVQSFSITIENAVGGNGMYSTENGEVAGIELDTGNSALDLSQELVGQNTGKSVWGSTDGTGGNFVFFGSAQLPGPITSGFFTITTSSGMGDDLQLTSFAPLALLGDTNLDGEVNLLDVAPFVDRLIDGVFQEEADINGDGEATLLDVSLFVALLSDG